MEIKVNHKDDVAVISIKGELDAKSSPELTQAFDNQINEGYVNFVADLKELDYSSSAGIRIFLGSARNSRQHGGDLRIAAVQPQVDRIFKLSKFEKIVKIFPSVDEAVTSYNQAGN